MRGVVDTQTSFISNAEDQTIKKLDTIDQKIILELAADARLPVSSIAARVDLSRNAVQQRIEKLERDGVIAGYTIKLGSDDAKTGKTIAIVHIERKDRMRGADVLKAIKSIHEIKCCYVLSGSKDLLIEIEASDSSRVSEICSTIWDMPGVKDTQTNFVLSTAKVRE